MRKLLLNLERCFVLSDQWRLCSKNVRYRASPSSELLHDDKVQHISMYFRGYFSWEHTSQAIGAHHFSAIHGRCWFMTKSILASPHDLLLEKNLHFIQKRFKHSRKTTSSKQKEILDSDRFSDDEELEEEEFDGESIHFKEDEELPPNYRDIKGHVKNLRLDSIVGFGLAMNRRKVEDYFLDSKLRVNGNRVLKKSIKVGSGDYVDVIIGHGDGVLTVKRVRIVNVKTHGDSMKATVYLRVWRGGAEIPVVKAKFTKDS